MQESFILKGFQNAYIVENDPCKVTELMTVTREIDTFPEEKEIVDFMERNHLDRCEIVKSYKR
jgi:hypothetical protein